VSEWKTVRCLVEVRVRGDLTERDWRFAVELALKEGQPEKKARMAKLYSFGKVRVLQWGRVRAHLMK
jgi:hypothetical protein